MTYSLSHKFVRNNFQIVFHIDGSDEVLITTPLDKVGIDVFMEELVDFFEDHVNDNTSDIELIYDENEDSVTAFVTYEDGSEESKELYFEDYTWLTYMRNITLRNNEMSLDEQILKVRDDIRNGKSEYPIDITDENDNQHYYEDITGYWERNEFDSKGNLTSHTNTIVRVNLIKENSVSTNILVYLLNPLDSKEDFNIISNEEFKLKVEKQGMILNLNEFQNLFNEKVFDLTKKYIRFFKV